MCFPHIFSVTSLGDDSLQHLKEHQSYNPTCSCDKISYSKVANIILLTFGCPSFHKQHYRQYLILIMAGLLFHCFSMPGILKAKAEVSLMLQALSPGLGDEASETCNIMLDVLVTFLLKVCHLRSLGGA